MTKVIQVIFTDNRTKGTGVYPDPVRGITEILDFDGNTIVEYDPMVRYTKKDMINFSVWFKAQEFHDMDEWEDLFQKWCHSK